MDVVETAVDIEDLERELEKMMGCEELFPDSKIVKEEIDRICTELWELRHPDQKDRRRS